MNPLSPGQVVEMKKVFAMFNQSGSKKLNAEELSIALERISGSKPSLDEVQQLMSTFDKNNDGSVSWDEFYETLSTFIISQESGSSRFDKSDIFDKKRLHTNIADFFLQHKKCDNWDQLRQRRLQIASSIKSSLTEQEIVDENKKQESLSKCQQMCNKMPDIVSELHHSVGANDIKKATDCVQYLADILSILNVYNTAQDRLSIAEFLATLFRRIRDSNVSKKIIGFVSEDQAPQLQYQSCRFVVHYCQGPRIPNTPKESTLHPANMYHKGVCINNGVVPALEALFQSKQEQLRNKAIEAIGKIASHDGDARQYVINNGITMRLLALIQASASITTLRYVTWTLSIILGNTHTTECVKNFDTKLLQTTLEKLGKLLFEIVATFRKDFEAQNKGNNNNNNVRLSNNQKKELQIVLMNTLCCLSYLIPGIKNFPSFWRKFIELITFPVSAIQCMVLDCMIDIIEVDSNHLEQMLSFGLLKALNNPFTSSSKDDIGPRHKALSLLSSIVRTNNGKYVAIVVSSGYMSPLLELMNNDDLSRLTIVKIIRFITKNYQVTQQLVQQNSIIRRLGEALNSFKKFDPIIREVYHYVGPTYNFEFVEDLIEALNNILQCGALKVNNDQTQSNIFINKFDMQLLDRISDVIMKISSAKGIETWRNALDNKNNSSLENRLVGLLENIKFTHLQCQTKLSNEVKNFVNELIFNFRKSLSQNQYKQWPVPNEWDVFKQDEKSDNDIHTFSDYSNVNKNNKIRIKCFIQNKTQIFDNIDKNISINNLQYMLSSFCGCPVRIYYKDKFNNDTHVLIRGQNDLNNAILSATFNEVDLILVPVIAVNQNSNSISPSVSNPTPNNMFSDNAVINKFASDYGLPTEMINTLWISFRQKAKDGTINKQSFIDIMKQTVGVNDYAQIEQLFNAFDENKNGLLDFREICFGFTILHKGSPDDKIKLAFQAFDLDNNGKLAETELWMMFKSIVTIRGIRYNKKDIDRWCKECFAKYDIGKKKYLVFHEFSKMVHRRPLFIQTFLGFNKK